MSKTFLKPTDLGDYLFRITYNGGSSFDCYTVTFSDGSYLALSSYPNNPQGFSQSGESIDPIVQHEWVEQGEAVDLALGDLPSHIVEHIISRCNEGFSDYLKLIENMDPKAVAQSRKAAEYKEPGGYSIGKGIYIDDGAYYVKIEGDTDTDASYDYGPYFTDREALIATLPDKNDLSGPEYHSTIDNLMRMDPDAKVAEAVAKLEGITANPN